MEWSDIAKTIAADAPLLSGVLAATGVGAPAAAAVSLAGRIVASTLNVPATPNNVAQALSTQTPDIAVKLKQIEAAHGVQLAQIAASKYQADTAATVQLATVSSQDRDSARRREIATRGYTAPILAWVVVIASVALAAAVVTGHADAKDSNQSTMIGAVMGYIFSEAKTVLAYYFGSSEGSARKDAVIADQARG